jgi:hypothetical protein
MIVGMARTGRKRQAIPIDYNSMSRSRSTIYWMRIFSMMTMMAAGNGRFSHYTFKCM